MDDIKEKKVLCTNKDIKIATILHDGTCILLIFELKKRLRDFITALFCSAYFMRNCVN